MGLDDIKLKADMGTLSTAGDVRQYAKTVKELHAVQTADADLLLTDRYKLATLRGADCLAMQAILISLVAIFDTLEHMESRNGRQREVDEDGSAEAGQPGEED